VFGALNDWIGVWTSCFMLLFLLVATALTWMHFAIRRMELSRHPQIGRDTDLPEIMDATAPRRG
jgi:NNP family nitrate/nitrite transporter-like MFS transporter